MKFKIDLLGKRFKHCLMYWNPDVSIFNQNNGMDDDGVMPGFTNVPKSYEYYYELYPLLKPEY